MLTAAALDETTVTVRGTAEGVKQARAVVEDTKSEAKQSGNVVTQAVSALTEIEASSRRIGDIIDVIDEIAF